MNLDQYTLEQMGVLGALTVSAIGAVALATLWTVRGRRWRWRQRAMAVAALLAPLLLTPAFDLWSIFALQAVIMLAALATVRGVRAWWAAGFEGWTFRLTDALAATIYTALLVAPLAANAHRLPEPAFYVVRFGAGFALLGLVGIWLAVPSARWWGYVARAIVLLGLPVLTVELLDFSDVNMRQYYGYPYYWGESVLLTWITPLIVAVAARGSGMVCERERLDRGRTWIEAWGQRVGMVATAAMVLGVVVGYFALLDDPGHPQEPMPSPNGYDELNRVLAGFDAQLPVYGGRQATDSELAEFLARTAAVRLAAARAVELPSVARLGETSLSILGIQERRNLARAWVAEAASASRQGDVPRAMTSGWSLLELTKATWNGGIVVDMLVAIAIEGLAVHSIRSAPSWPDDPRWQPLLPRLLSWEADLETGATIQARDRRWDRHFYWQCRIEHLLERFGPTQGVDYTHFHARAMADVRLLALELALARYRAVHGENPDSLEQLVPEVLPAVPRDPFDETRPLSYRRQANGFLLYSVGRDGFDNGGKYKPPESMIGENGYDYRLP